MKKKKKVRLNYKNIFKLLISIIFIVVLIIFITRFIKDYKYKQSYEYKFLTIGYTKEEVKTLNSLTKEQKDYILTMEYEDDLVNILNQKYFLWKNLETYIKYKNRYTSTDYETLISLINVKANNDFYEEEIVKETNISNLYSILVNKFYYLPDNYDELIKDRLKCFSLSYSLGDGYCAIDEAYEAFMNMRNEAKDEDITLVVNDGYRSYATQETLYMNRKNSSSTREADKYAARPGYSEHQTGLALDISGYNSTSNDEAWEWLSKNAYKYGFILRYPENKEKLTGYEYEAWHYRYVGKELALKVYESGLSYDEYYAYYIEGEN